MPKNKFRNSAPYNQYGGVSAGLIAQSVGETVGATVATDILKRSGINTNIGYIPTLDKYVKGKGIGACREDTNFDSCESRCSRDPNCKSFDFGKKGSSKEGKCCLNTDIEPLTNTDNYVNYRKRENNRVSGYTLNLGKSGGRTNKIGNTIQDMTPTKCALKCHTTDGCVGFSMTKPYYSSGDQCSLRSAVNLIDSDNYDFYIKNPSVRTLQTTLSDPSEESITQDEDGDEDDAQVNNTQEDDVPQNDKFIGNEGDECLVDDNCNDGLTCKESICSKGFFDDPLNIALVSIGGLIVLIIIIVIIYMLVKK
tara:strand:+ start:2525 stop:3451 length:927 start_codon:yes stop_codon:yes gene_type:complete